MSLISLVASIRGALHRDCDAIIHKEYQAGRLNKEVIRKLNLNCGSGPVRGADIVKAVKETKH